MESIETTFGNWHSLVTETEWKRLLVRVPRRVGTTTLIRRLAAQEISKGGSVLIVCPTTQMAQVLYIDYMPKYKNLHVIGGDPTPMCGSEKSLLLVDTAALMTPGVIDSVIPLTLGYRCKDSSRMAFFSVWYPTLSNWFSQEWELDGGWEKILVDSFGRGKLVAR